MNACSQVVAAVSTLAFALLSTEVSSNDKAKVQADAVKVRETLTSMGATFIKVGQVLANRPDIIRADYMDELTKLQVNLPYICPFLSVTDTTRLLSHTTALSHTTLSHTTLSHTTLSHTTLYTLTHHTLTHHTLTHHTLTHHTLTHHTLTHHTLTHHTAHSHSPHTHHTLKHPAHSHTMLSHTGQGPALSIKHRL